MDRDAPDEHRRTRAHFIVCSYPSAFKEEQTLFTETVQAIKASLQSQLGIVFMIGVGAMLLAFLLILAVPEVSLQSVA
jgi:hypothetical protein